MRYPSFRILVSSIAFTVAAGQTASAQNGPWELTHSLVRPKGRILVVTMDHPNRFQGCRVKDFTADKLVCSRTIGGRRIFAPGQVVALIDPGDDDYRRRAVFIFNVGLGASIWGTVVLAAACPACAVATGVAALFFFDAAVVTLIGDGVPNRLLYLKPSQSLSAKLGYVQSNPG
jgi:hypothetical protein